MEDSNLIDFSDGDRKKINDDFISIIMDILSKMNYKIAFFLFVFFIILMSDAFQDYVLIQFNGAMIEGSITSYGHVVQGVFLVIFYLIFDILVQCQIV